MQGSGLLWRSTRISATPSSAAGFRRDADASQVQYASLPSSENPLRGSEGAEKAVDAFEDSRVGDHGAGHFLGGGLVEGTAQLATAVVNIAAGCTTGRQLEDSR